MRTKRVINFILQGVRCMYNRKVYEPEFKLNIVKEYLSKEYSISPSMFFKWLKKYKESGYVNKGRPESVIQ